jgi:hypothetical protein
MRVIHGRDGSRLIIIGEADYPGVCEECLRPVSERRPYGPNRKWICVDCAEKDMPAVERRMRQIASGESDN